MPHWRKAKVDLPKQYLHLRVVVNVPPVYTHSCQTTVNKEHSQGTTASPELQGITMKQLSYIVDPCMEHTPTSPPTPANIPPAAKPGPKPTPKPTLGSTTADKTSRSLVQAFQQDILAAFGKEWVGITGNASFMPTEVQYAQLLRQAAGVVYCGMGRFLQYVPPAVVTGADMRACELAVVLDRGQSAKRGMRQVLPKGCGALASPA